MAKYIRRNRRASLEEKKQKQEIDALRFAPTSDTPKAQTPIKIPPFIVPFERKFEAISRAFRQSLVTAEKVHAHIEELPDETYRHSLHEETAELTHKIIKELLAELDSALKNIPADAKKLRSAVEQYRQPFVEFLSVSPEAHHQPTPTTPALS